MKPKKVSLTGIKEKMTRLEMKNIMAGSGFARSCIFCNSDYTCMSIGRGYCSGVCIDSNTGIRYRVCEN